MRTFDKIPPLLKPGEGKAAWETRRGELIDTISGIEYGRRPDMEYTVCWKLKSRETVLEGKADRLLTDITVTTKLGSHTFPLYTFLPRSKKKVPATVLICSQSRAIVPPKMPEGFSMEAIPGILQS